MELAFLKPLGEPPYRVGETKSVENALKAMVSEEVVETNAVTPLIDLHVYVS